MTGLTESLRDGLVAATELVILAIDIMALAIVVVGSLQAFAAGTALMLSPSVSSPERRMVWLRYARVLVAALTLQLAADIVETSITADWEGVARLGIIAVIRTFLNYFLERDLDDIREGQSADPERAAGPSPRD